MWRFVVAIGAFAVAMVLLVTGLSFKFAAGPRTVSESFSLSPDDGVFYAVIDPSVVQYQPGLQSLTASGGSANFVAYGRTIDVLSWMGTSPYFDITRNAKSGKVTVTTVRPETTEDSPTPASVNPAGSDMWLDESLSSRLPATLQMSLPSDMSIIVAGDGATTTPSTVSVSWPLPQPTFLWMTEDQLLLGGGILAAVGILLYLWALSVHRKKQGPRRKTPRPPTPRTISRRRHEGIVPTKSRGRRAAPRRLGFVVVPFVLVSTLGLASCANTPSAQSAAPTPTPTSTSVGGVDLPPVAVTEEQFKVILEKTRATTTQADQALDGKIAEARFAGPALDARRSSYAIVKADSSLLALPTVPDTSVALFLPEATDTWPRELVAVFQPRRPGGQDKDKAQPDPTVALVMQQTSPRENYKIVYQVNLQPNQEVPEVAVPETGTVAIPADSKLLVMPPNQVAAAYADILQNGDNSQYAPLFNKNMDTLRPLIATERGQQNADNVDISFADRAGSGPVIAMATVDSGALVAVSVDEIGTYAPRGGRSLKLTGALKALAGIELSPKVVDATYQFQILFYVPPLGSNEQIQVVGYTETLVKVAQR